MPDPLAELTGALRAPDPASLLVVTGAGVSLASGIPTFRGSDPGAVWARDVTELGTLRFFRDDPVASWRFYLDRFDRLAGAQPNPAHRALVDLEKALSEKKQPFLLVTQNIDGLHRAAGSTQLVEVHGRADRVRCSAIHCVNAAPRGSLDRASLDLNPFRASPSIDTIPRCPICHALLRPHLLWFDERYDEHRDYEIERVLRFGKHARIVVFAGTSFQVGLTQMVIERGLARQAAMFSIDPSGSTPHRRVAAIADKAEDVLPALVRQLK